MVVLGIREAGAGAGAFARQRRGGGSLIDLQECMLQASKPLGTPVVYDRGGWGGGGMQQALLIFLKISNCF